jgi:hypothetical protein
MFSMACSDIKVSAPKGPTKSGTLGIVLNQSNPKYDPSFERFHVIALLPVECKLQQHCLLHSESSYCRALCH